MNNIFSIKYKSKLISHRSERENSFAKLNHYLAVMVLFLFSSVLHSQTINVKNAYLVIDQNVHVKTGGGVLIQTGGNINNKGFLYLGLNWINNGNGLINGSTGTVQFNGTGAQSAGGTNATTFYNLFINNTSSGVNLSRSFLVNGTLNFINGKINTTPNYNISLSAGSPITGAGTGKYVNGNLRIAFNTGAAQSRLFTIGDNNAYAPIQLSNLNVTAAGNLTAFTNPGLNPSENIPVANASGISQTARANRYWNMNQETGFNAGFTDAIFNFVSGDVTGNPLNYVVRKFNSPSTWNLTTNGNRTSESTEVLAMTNLSAEYEVGEIVPNLVNCNDTLKLYTSLGSCSVNVSNEQLSSHISYSGSPVPTVTFSPAGGVFNIGPTPVTATISNMNGSATCNFVLMVYDTIRPDIICPADRLVNSLDDNTSLAMGFASATDNCSSVTFSESDISTQDLNPSVPEYNNYLIYRTWTATDSSGNSSQCMQTITVDSTAPPTVICPLSLEISCTDDTSTTARGVATGVNLNISYTDSSTQVLDNTRSGFFNYDIYRTWMGIRINDDLTEDTGYCTQLIQVRDEIRPVIVCPVNVNIDCEDDTSVLVNGMASATDNCSSTTLSYSDISTQNMDNTQTGFYNYVISRLWTSVDITGNISNCTQTINVSDTEDPVIDCPDSLFISCGENNLPLTASDSATVTDNCSATVISFTDISTQDPDNSNASFYNYEITRTWRAVDVSGNTSECIQIITVQDTLQPEIVCPLDTTIKCQDDISLIVSNTANSTDNCSPVVISFTDLSNQHPESDSIGFYNYIITRTWTATDVSGNSSNCNQLITVKDIEFPLITCPDDITLNCQDDISPLNTGTALAEDACSLVNISYADSSTQNLSVDYSGYYNYQIFRTWKAMDISGNSAQCLQVITVRDITSPDINCPQDISISCADDTRISITGEAAAFDACSAVNFSFTDISTKNADSLSFDHYNYTITRTWRVTDISGNFSNCVQIITVRDTTEPTITCPDNISLYCQDDISVSLLGEAQASDNCSPVSVNLNESSNRGTNPLQASFYNYTLIRTWTATDISGYSGSCSQTINVVDVTEPSISCPLSVTLNCQDDLSYYIAEQPLYNDNCSPVTLAGTTNSTQSVIATEAEYYNYIITKEWTVTDASGNSNACAQLINVLDTTPPQIVCPDPITVNCDDDIFLLDENSISTSDNCSPVTIIMSENNTQDSVISAQYYNYTINQTFVVSDVSGNNTQCIFTVFVQDTTSPSVSCPPNIVEDTELGSCEKIITYAGSASDLCSPVTLTYTQNSGSSFPSGTTTVTLTASDVSFNQNTCSFTVTINDIEAPVAVCKNSTVYLDANGDGVALAFDINNGSTDNCGNIELQLGTLPDIDYLSELNSGVSESLNDRFISFTPTDSAFLNSIELYYPDTVSNGSLQLFTYEGIPCQSAETVLGTTNTVSFANTLNGWNNYAFLPPVRVNAGTTYYVRTNSGSILGLLSSNDNPVIGSLLVNDCSIASDEFMTRIHLSNPNNYTCNNIGSNPVELVVSDVAGNSSSCSAIVTVLDTVSPVALCKNVTVQLDALGEASTTAQNVNDSSYDACGILSLSLRDVNFLCENTGPNQVVLTVTDNNGNISTCDAVVTVEDNIFPSEDCRDVTVYLDSSGLGNTTAVAIGSNSFDNCGLLPQCIPSGPNVTCLSGLMLDKNKFNCNNIGLNTVTLTVTDVHYNQSTCTATVTVFDYIAPVAICQDVTIQLDSTGNGFTTPEDVNNGSSDACGIQSLVLTQTEFDCSEVGQNSEVLTVTDVNGNSTTCSTTVTVIDGIAPIAVCQDVTVALDRDGNASVTPTQIDNGSSDACGIASLSIVSTSTAVFNCTNTGTNTVTLKVTDVNGNSSTCNSVVTVTGGALYKYVILADEEVHLHNSNILSGGVGVMTTKGTAKIHEYTTITAAGTFVESPLIDINNGSLVATQLNAVATAPLPVFETNPFTSNNDITVLSGQTLTLNDTIYNKIKVEKYGTVIFTRPVVNIRHLDSKEFTTIKFTQCTKVRVKEHLHLKRNTRFNPDGLAVTVFAQKHVDVHEGSAVFATLYAKDEHIHVKGKENNRSTMTGLFIAKKVEKGDYTDWNANTQCGRCSVNPALEVKVTASSDVNCDGASNGSATVVATGGIAPYTYSWNTVPVQTGATASNLVPGSYTATATDATGTIASVTASIIVFNYTILASEEIKLSKNDTVFTGSIGVTNVNGKINIENNSSVEDDNSIVIAPIISIDATSSVEEDVYGIAAPVVTAFEGNIPYISSSDLIVANNITYTMTANDTLRRKITLEDNATLIISGSRLNITDKLEMKKNAKIIFTQSCVKVRIKNVITTSDNPVINPTGKQVTFHINGNKVEFKKAAKITGTFYAPNAEFIVKNSSALLPNIMTGRFIVKKMSSGDFTNWYENTACPCSSGSGGSNFRMIEETPTADEIKQPAIRDIKMTAFPNPFKNTVNIAFSLPERSENVMLTIFNLEGRNISQLYDGPVEANTEYQLKYKADGDIESGIYFYRLETKEGKVIVQKLILLK